MKLPDAIQRQVDEAEALERQLYQQDNTGTDTSSELVAQEETPSENVETPETQSEVVPTPELKAKPGREEDVDYWRSRANALYGMNQQLASDHQQFKAQIQSLTEQVARMKAEGDRVKETTSNDNDAETFGEDLVGAIDRRAEQMARTMVSQETAELRTYIQQLEAKLSNVGDQVAVSAQDRFYTTLGKMVPDYEAVNAEQGFLNWLGETDPVYGVPRQVALDAAANSNDPERVAAIFNAYKVLTRKQVDAQQSQQKQQQVRQELERQTAPSSTRGSQQASAGGKVWSLQEYEQALDPRNIGSMGRQRADELAAEAELAYSEGRVRF